MHRNNLIYVCMIILLLVKIHICCMLTFKTYSCGLTGFLKVTLLNSKLLKLLACFEPISNSKITIIFDENFSFSIKKDFSTKFQNFLKFLCFLWFSKTRLLPLSNTSRSRQCLVNCHIVQLVGLNSESTEI